MSPKTDLEIAKEAFNKFRAEADLANESDRGSVLCRAAYLDVLLTDVINSLLVDCNSREKLFERQGPLSDSNSLNLLAHSLGFLTDQQFKTLNTIRKIRN